MRGWEMLRMDLPKLSHVANFPYMVAHRRSPAIWTIIIPIILWMPVAVAAADQNIFDSYRRRHEHYTVYERTFLHYDDRSLNGRRHYGNPW